MPDYRIAGNFRWRKFDHFANNIFANQHYCPIFVNKNKTFADNIFANSLYFAKIFFCENFLLYSINNNNIIIILRSIMSEKKINVVSADNKQATAH